MDKKNQKQPRTQREAIYEAGRSYDNSDKRSDPLLSILFATTRALPSLHLGEPSAWPPLGHMALHSTKFPNCRMGIWGILALKERTKAVQFEKAF